MKFIAMKLRLALHEKFPEAPEDDIIKVVGNLLYYRYMNPAIVAPDAFDIVDVGMDNQLTPDQVGGAVSRLSVMCFHIIPLSYSVVILVLLPKCFKQLLPARW